MSEPTALDLRDIGTQIRGSITDDMALAKRVMVALSSLSLSDRQTIQGIYGAQWIESWLGGTPVYPAESGRDE